LRSLTTRVDVFDLKQPFTISTGTIRSLAILYAEIEEDGFVGRGECVPSAENMVSIAEGKDIAHSASREIERLRNDIERGLNRADLQRALPAGPPRNALDCALWDLECKRQEKEKPFQIRKDEPFILQTASTIPLASPENMAKAAAMYANRPLLKLKLGGQNDLECMAAVREEAPVPKIIVDVNGGWDLDRLVRMSEGFVDYDVSLIEQPLQAGHDEELYRFDAPIPLCADESCHDRSDLDYVADRYRFINIKLDKCGGPTEAMAMIEEAKSRNLGLMVGCMAGTSLSMIPAAHVGRHCEFVDLDGPQLLAKDRWPAIRYENGCFSSNRPDIWG